MAESGQTATVTQDISQPGPSSGNVFTEVIISRINIEKCLAAVQNMSVEEYRQWVIDNPDQQVSFSEDSFDASTIYECIDSVTELDGIL